MADKENNKPSPRRARARTVEGQYDRGYEATEIQREVGEKTVGKYDQKEKITKPKFQVRTEYH